MNSKSSFLTQELGVKCRALGLSQNETNEVIAENCTRKYSFPWKSNIHLTLTPVQRK